MTLRSLLLLFLSYTRKDEQGSGRKVPLRGGGVKENENWKGPILITFLFPHLRKIYQW